MRTPQRRKTQRNTVDGLFGATSEEDMMKEGLGFVMGVNLVIWCGIAFYLFILDKRIKKLENTSEDQF